MSVVTYAVCLKCKEKLWVGQGHTLYTGESETMQLFRDFIDEHIVCDEDGIRLLHDVGKYENDLYSYTVFEGKDASDEETIHGNG